MYDKELAFAQHVILNGSYDEQTRNVVVSIIEGTAEQLSALEVENKRLRSALEKIAEGKLAPSSFSGHIDEAYQTIAREALNAQEHNHKKVNQITSNKKKK